MAIDYGLLKGTLKYGIPYFPRYRGNPHYFLIVDINGENKQILVNTKSNIGSNEKAEVLFHIEHFFQHPINSKVKQLDFGIYRKLQNLISIKGLDYWRDKKLLDVRRMTNLPFDSPGENNDLNEVISDLLSIDLNQQPEPFTVTTPNFQEERNAYQPRKNVTVYIFGDIFEDETGMHNVHMNQGNSGSHSSDNGIFHDGALTCEIEGDFVALFLAFQSQKLPTNSKGKPLPTAKPILDIP